MSFFSFFPPFLLNQRFRGFFPSSGFQRVNEGNKQDAFFFSPPEVFEICLFLTEALNWIFYFFFPLIEGKGKKEWQFNKYILFRNVIIFFFTILRLPSITFQLKILPVRISSKRKFLQKLNYYFKTHYGVQAGRCPQKADFAADISILKYNTLCKIFQIVFIIN